MELCHQSSAITKLDQIIVSRSLTAAEKEANRQLAKLRVRVEHAIAGVKRSRIVKDVFRNKKPGLSDASMEVACGLHNLRVSHRQSR
jgi:DDE superfamily endonuclease